MCKDCGNEKKFRGQRQAEMEATEYFIAYADEDGRIEEIDEIYDSTDSEVIKTYDEQLDECDECGSGNIGIVKDPKEIKRLKDKFLAKQILEKV